MLVAFAVGLTAGLIVHATAADAAWLRTVTIYITQPIGQIFLRLLFMLVIPLLFSALVMGIAEMGDLGSLRRIGLKTLLFTISISCIAVLIALAVVNLFRPGEGGDPALAQALLANARDGAQSILTGVRDRPDGMAALVGIVPSNIIAAAAANDILAVMFFALFFGIGIVLVQSPASDQLGTVIQGMFEVTMRLIGLVIRLAPIAVACFMFNLAALFGWALLERLGAYVGVVLLALSVHMFLVYPLMVRALGKMSPLHFFRQSQEAMVMAFSTASSNATLPTSIRVAEHKLLLPPRVARFVLTIGSTANQNGTAIFEGVTVLFLAQFFGVELGLFQQFVVLLVCTLGGIGAVGVPGGSLPVVALVLGMVGVPAEGVGLVLGVDRFLDMCRTALNVTGDLVAAVVISRGESDASADFAPPSADPLLAPVPSGER
ncbi:dicarboxylate/amino acid:cation symporter [Rhizorhabdus dicambivorans]|uniref:Dicarboxylate/amino acid:cation symporter n=2 Tax=Rhizorhabdus dicambivorans TaxID=1850238 RepID=A0A2A4FTZ8_9SPHN|nr:dicarboxylate/amino acid:cation symporter [Rhizorhabdus dicambivorans]PCE41176.1 dicarboxylate/amino acid:cation symporter [Rhizorhabdus dicambivorans]